MPAFIGFATEEDLNKVLEATRWALAQMGKQQAGDGYRSPSVTVLIKPASDLTADDGPAPTEAGVAVCVPVYRDFRETNPDSPDAWKEYGPAENHYCEAFAPNKETLVVGQRYQGRAVGVADVAPFRTRIQVTTGGDRSLFVQTMASDAGTGSWTRARVMAFGANGGVVAAADNEVVGVRHLNAFSGSKLRLGGYYTCMDTGATGQVPGAAGQKRLLYAVGPPMKRVVLGVSCNPQTGRVEMSADAATGVELWVFDV